LKTRKTVDSEILVIDCHISNKLLLFTLQHSTRMQINMQLMNVGRLADRNKVKYAVTSWCLATSNYMVIN